MQSSEALALEHEVDETMTDIDRRLERISLELLRDKSNEALIAQYQDLLRKRRRSLVKLPRFED